jgi:hypothetical protein
VDVAVITPAVEDKLGGVYAPDTSVGAEAYVTAFGVVKFVWFRTLKNSERNCRFTPSRS